MKKRIPLILVCLCIGIVTMIAFSGCGRSRALSVPKNVEIDRITQTLSWRAVGGAAYYTIEITGNGETVQKDSRKNSYSLERLGEGNYTLRVRAIASSDGERSNSDWSESLPFEREHETGLAFALTDSGKSFVVTGLGTASGKIVVPDTYRGLPVTGIADRAFYNKSNVTEVILGNRIESIGEQAFANCSYLTNVTFPDGLRTIGKMAFQSCRVLVTPIVFPSGVESISEQAFQYCRQLPSVTLTENIKEIGAGAFDGCERIESVEIPNSVITMGDAAFARCTSLKNLTLGGGLSEIGADMFRECASLTAVSIGNGIYKIGNNAFTDCVSLQSVTMGDGTAIIGDFAFSGCKSLPGVEHLSRTLTRIGQSAFNGTMLYEREEDLVYIGNWFLGCKSGDMQGKKIADGTIGIADRALAKCGAFDDILTMPNSLAYVGDGAFSNCAKLTGVILGRGIVRIGNEAFLGCTALTSAILGEYDKESLSLGRSNLIEIGDYAFGACSSLNAIDIPYTVVHIGMHAFRNSGIYDKASREVYAGNWVVDCKSDGVYGTVSIQNGTAGIADYAFYRCSGIGAVMIPDSVGIIGKSAFYKCKALSSVTLPAGLTEIKDYTFYYCSELVLPKFPETLQKIGRSAFYKCRLVSESNEGDSNLMVIPNSVIEIGDYAFYGCTYTYVDRDSTEKKNGGIDILKFGTGLQKLGNLSFSGIVTLKQVTFEGGLSEIGEKAFYKCTSLANVTFSEGLREIGSKTFYGCSALTSVSLPTTLSFVGDYAFYRCTSLQDVNLGGAEQIGASAFLGCVRLEKLTFPATLKEIDKQAFRGCTALTSVVIPKSLTTVGAHAFYGCRNLTIYTAYEDVPEGFHERWNSSYRPLVLDALLSSDESVSSFIWGASSVRNLNDTNRLSGPIKDGYSFLGWSTAENGDVEYTEKTLSAIADGTRLYAIYRSNE